MVSGTSSSWVRRRFEYDAWGNQIAAAQTVGAQPNAQEIRTEILL